ncbi:hypothetical protein C8Q76DRAFT_690695 [Earliella scabrosa]|nr:hypothetical protein C8Q76DRAFT_690695 [Earliella scabrosa]
MSDLNAVPLWDLPPPPQYSLPAIPSSLSVQDLMLLPHLPHPGLPPRTRPLAFAISRQVAQVDPQELRERELPSRIDVLATIDALTLRSDRQSQSFIDVRMGAEILTPLWVLGWWMTFHRAIEARDRWRGARSWLAELRYDSEGPEAPIYVAVTTALATLERIPWDEPLTAAYGLRPEDLADFLGMDPVYGPILDAMLDAVNERIRQDAALDARVLVLTLYTYYIFQASPDQWTRYDTHPRFSFLRHLSARIRDPGDPLQTIYMPWHDHNAWVLFALNVPDRTIRYADSSGIPPSDAHLRLFQTWFTAAQLGTWTVGPPLRCGSPDDGISCGIVVVNAIQHALFGDRLWDIRERPLWRVLQYLNIVRAYVPNTR